MMRISMLVCLLLAGCVWITDGDHDDRMDLDGDGFQYDEDCDDDDDAVGAMGTWYADVDGDGYGDANTPLEACEAPSDAVLDATDCDDSLAAIHPAADEACDGVDNDCDDLIDDADDSLTDADDWYPDGDGDGFGDGFGTPVQACDPPADHTGVDDATDCDDADDSVYPDADEYCDEIDHDCDGESWDDDAVDAGTWYLDGDGDEYGVDDDTTVACEQPSGYADMGGDCDDGDTDFNPGAAEEDCSDPADYNCDGSTGYVDDDGDGFPACEECDDTDAAVNPDASEYCDGADNDCDGDIDEEPRDGSTWFIDDDSDGYGVADTTMDACEQPSGYAAVDTDCDDADAALNPGATELCNGFDDNCDGLVDDDDPAVADQTDWSVDDDGDGYGAAAAPVVTRCDQPSGYVADGTDCDDTDPIILPGTHELGSDLCFDGVDNDCDGNIDATDATCAACPYTCAVEACVFVDGVREAEQSTALASAMAGIDSLVLRDATFDRVLVGVAGTVAVSEDFDAGLGCFTVGTLAGTTLEAGKAAACPFGEYDFSAGDWMVAVDVLADSTDATVALMDAFFSGSTWYDWASTPVLDDGDDNTVPFTSGAPDLASEHLVVMCGMTP